jgi:hypothetical protein
MSSETPLSIGNGIDHRHADSDGLRRTGRRFSDHLAHWWSATESLLVRAGDRLNPILVKETRQALKSRQFVLTFSLLLILAWVWTIVGVVWMGPEVWYGAKGQEMFFGYYLILAFPLLVVVPFSALRSLAGEHEERTYDLLSITTLGPRQIVSGKLGSAALQILVYLSAIAPCLAFTYLLRGIDVLTILFIVTWTVLAGLGLSMVSLLIGTLATEKHWQVVLGVGCVIGLFYAFGGGCAATIAIFEEGDQFFGLPHFWAVMGGCLAAYLSYFALAFFAAAARLTFASGNRSTAVRVVMLAQQALLAGWTAWICLEVPYSVPETPAIALVVLGLHWYAMGVFMTGESPHLSHRVKRRLPQSLLGRAFLTWFNPGPGTGYVFALSAMVAGVLLAAMAFHLGLVPDEPRIVPRALRIRSMSMALGTPAAWWQNEAGMMLAVGAVALSYLAFYLGIGLLVLRLLRRVTKVGTLLTLLVHFLVAVAGVFIPMVAQEMSRELRGGEYTLLQVTNVPWTLEHVFRLLGSRSAGDLDSLLMLLGWLALVVLLLNAPGIAREVRQERIERPRRVVEDDAAMMPVSPAAPSSPWDRE